VQLEEEKVNEPEDTTFRIICGQPFAQDEAEELKVQLSFVSQIRCHDARRMDLLNQTAAKIRSI
jgi:hypothetical protein